MRKKSVIFFICFLCGLCVIPGIVYGSERDDTLKPFYFIKKERITGVVFKGNQEREQFITDNTKTNEELFTGSAKFQLGRQFWNLLDYKQEKFEFVFETGPFIGTGDRTDSSKMEYIIADQKMIGLRNNLALNYFRRSYYDHRNYTLVEVNAWGRFDIFRQNNSGILKDSNLVEFNYSNIEHDDKLRYGFQAKAGWGFGRLNPMNHYMVSEFLLDKYYNRRVFSDEEIIMLAKKIGQIKHKRDPKIKREIGQEIAELNDFIKTKLLLKNPGNTEMDWQMGEFLPRFDGKRIGIGPFFNYYNREPDFVYGAYLSTDYAKYINVNWNNNISFDLSYNRYEINKWVRDWILLETNFGWTYYPNLKTQINFGIKYIPAMVVNEFSDLEPVRHNFIPYLEYYTQANSKTRVDLAFAWIFADGKQFMQSGPELKVAIYSSRY